MKFRHDDRVWEDPDEGWMIGNYSVEAILNDFRNRKISFRIEEIPE